MSKVGLSTGFLQRKYGDREALRIAKEAGADAVDFSLDGVHSCDKESSVYSRAEEEIIAYFSDLKEFAKELELEICQTHGRVCGLKGNREQDELFYRNSYLDCMATAALGAPACVVHAVTTMYHMDKTPAEMREMNFEMFTRIIPYAKQFGIKIATETFGDVHGGKCCDFFGNLDEFIDSYERVCKVEDFRDYFTVCMDTGHTNKATKFSGNPRVPEAIRILGDRITLLHLNDNNTENDQHLIPFMDQKGAKLSGIVNWNETLAALRDIGYSGVYNMELNLLRYGEDVMPEMSRFAVAVMRNALRKNEM